MSTPGPSQSAIHRLSFLLARMLLGAMLLLAAAGLIAVAAGISLATPLLTAACAVLVVGPVLNVLAEMAEEIRRKDWAFSLAAASVVALIAYTALSRM